MYKSLQVKDKDELLVIIAKTMFNISADAELAAIKAIHRQTTNLSLNSKKHINKAIASECGITTAGLSSMIYKLSKKGVLSKQSGVIRLHPNFNLQDIKGIVFKLL